MPVLRTVLLIAVLLLGWAVLRGGVHLPAAASPMTTLPVGASAG